MAPKDFPSSFSSFVDMALSCPPQTEHRPDEKYTKKTHKISSALFLSPNEKLVYDVVAENPRPRGGG